MILASMETQQRYEEFREVALKLSRICASGRIAGGYARDAVFGRDANDIDFWIPIRYYREPARRAALVEELGDALGQYNFRNVVTRVTTDEVINPRSPFLRSGPAPSYASENTRLTEAWEADQEAFINRGNYNKLQVLFVEQPSAAEVVGTFHIDLCKAIQGRDFTPEAGVLAYTDYNLRRLTVNSFSGQTPERVVDYIRKLRQKYEDFRVSISVPVNDQQFLTYYSALLHGELLNAPRAVLSTQTQASDRDTVRLDHGTITGREATAVRGRRPTASQWVSIADILAREAEEVRAGTVLDQIRRRAVHDEPQEVDDLADRIFSISPEPAPVLNAQRVQSGLSGGTTTGVWTTFTTTRRG